MDFWQWFWSAAGITACAGAVALVLRASMKADKRESLMGAVLRAMAWVDAAIPDDLEGDTKVTRALKKANRFSKVFPQAYTEFYGKRPRKRTVRKAKALLEQVCETRRRSGPLSPG